MSGQKQTAPAEELRRVFMDHLTPLTEAGHWARRHIERLEAERDELIGANTLKSDNARMKARLIELAAQMATRRGMPSPDDWPGWGSRVPQKLWRAARDECDKASDQCADWAYELRKIADAALIPNEAGQ